MRPMLVSNGTAFSERPYAQVANYQTKTCIPLMYVAMYATLACLPFVSIE
jgi:hypothetical protein